MRVIEEGIRKIFLYISIFIYQLITDLYDMFERLCKSRILDTETLNSISQRVGILLGLVMLFIVSFSVIQMILEPDKLTDKEKGIGNITKKIILVIVMMGTSSFVFNMLYSVQRTIIDSHVISKFLLPYEADLDNFGGVLSAELFTTFFQSNGPNYEEEIELLKSEIIRENNFRIATDIVNDNEGIFGWGKYKIKFNFLWCPLLGLGALYFLFSYCITVGIRTVQLAFLEIISPAAIISYLSPKKDTMFEKWWKVYFATYLDAFIRIMIINLAVFLIAVILDSDMSSTFAESVGGTNAMINIFMILALLTFAKKAPELLKDLFPAGASKLGFGGFHMKDAFGLQKGLATITGAATGAAVGLIGGRSLGSFLGGAFRGGHAGFGAKNVRSSFGAASKAQADNLAQLRNLRNDGGSRLGRFMATVSNTFGLETAADRYDTSIKQIENNIQTEKDRSSEDRRRVKLYSAVRDTKKKMEDRAESKLLGGTFATTDARYAMQQRVLAAKAKIDNLKQSGTATEAEIAQATMDYNAELDRTKKEYITQLYRGGIPDKIMQEMRDDISATIANNADAFNGINTTINDFVSLDRFDGAVSTRSNAINRTISASDVRIQGMEDDILNIKSSQDYRRAQANKKNIKN